MNTPSPDLSFELLMTKGRLEVILDDLKANVKPLEDSIQEAIARIDRALKTRTERAA